MAKWVICSQGEVEAIVVTFEINCRGHHETGHKGEGDDGYKLLENVGNKSLVAKPSTKS